MREGETANGIRQLENMIHALEEETASLKTELASIKEEKAKLEKEVRNLRKKAEKVSGKIKTLQKRKKTIEDMLTKICSSDPTTFLKAYHGLDKFAGNDKTLKNIARIIKEDKRPVVTQIKMEFGARFRRLCQEEGFIPVEGDEIAGFRVKGLFVIKVKWEKAEAYVTTLLQSPPRKVSSISPEEVLAAVRELYKRLFGRPFNPEEFISRLYDAYLRVAGTLGKDILMERVQPIVSNRKDEFCVDIGRLISAKHYVTHQGAKVHFSPGMGGLPIYDESGHLRTYKFIRFVEESL